jgi:glycosyltransferase involved in cell wall biosynthesis
MKLVIIGQTLNKNHATKISGGIQTVERLHVKIFLNAGWEVYFIAPSCSESFNDHPDFHLCKCTLPAQDGCGDLKRADKAKHSKTLAADIQGFISEVQPDLIINHSFSSSHVRISAGFAAKIPTLCFVHNLPDTAMDIGIIAKVQHYLAMTKAGGDLVCVSEYQRDLWRLALKKRLNSGSDSFSFITEHEIDQVYDKYCYPIFIEKQTIKQPDKFFIVISRPDPIKNVSKLLELSKGLDYKLHMFLAHPGPLAENEYYTNKILPHLTSNIIVHHNAPRHELLDCLAHAAGCFIPCTVEAAPVALLEAASYGVYSIVFAKERDGLLDHAACHLLTKDDVALINVSQKTAAEELREAINLYSQVSDRFDPFDAESCYLADSTYQKHSFQKRSEDLLKITSDVMKRYTKKKDLLSWN